MGSLAMETLGDESWEGIGDHKTPQCPHQSPRGMLCHQARRWHGPLRTGYLTSGRDE